MDQACHLLLAWLGKEFPGSTYPLEHWSRDDAAEYLPAGAGVPPDLAHEAIEVFAKRTAPPPAARKELAVVRGALKEHTPSVILAALRSQGVAKRLRKAPAVRLLLDRDLMVRPWGYSSTGGDIAVGDARD